MATAVNIVTDGDVSAEYTEGLKIAKVGGTEIYIPDEVVLKVTVSTQDGVEVTGQTVYVHEGDSAEGPVLESKPYENATVEFVVPKGMQYFVTVSDTLSGHFNPTTATGYADATTEISLVYKDVSTVTMLGDIAQCLAAIGDVETAQTLLIGKTFPDTWTDYDATASGDAKTKSDAGETEGVAYESNTDASGHPIWYDPWVITNVQEVEDADGETHIGAVLIRKYCGRYDIVFDAANTEEATEETAVAGIYYYGLSGTTYALLSLTEGDTIPYSDYDKVYKNAYRDSSFNMIRYGHNRYETSAIRQYLNSSGEKGTWWTQQHVGQVKPSSATNYSGYLRGCTSEILGCAKAAKRNVMSNTTCDGGATYTVCDRFFLTAVPEMYGTDNTGDGDYQRKYWTKLLADDTASPLNDSTALNAVRKMCRVSAKTSAANVWLRSAYRGHSCTVWNVASGGYIGYGTAYASVAPAPACVIY